MVLLLLSRMCGGDVEYLGLLMIMWTEPSLEESVL
jgi:hypothetical protein